MNCDECIERVFELIEQEASDPERVRAILDRCPDCRALFEQTKATLALLEDQPLEEPPAGLDLEIRRAAREKVTRAAKSSKPPWVPRAPHWAMAAVALLAIGLGMWARPRSVRMEEELPVGDELQAERAEPKGYAVQREEAAELDLAQSSVETLPAREALATESVPKAPSDVRGRPGAATNESLAELAADAAIEPRDEPKKRASVARSRQTQVVQTPSQARGEREEAVDREKTAARAPAAVTVSEPASAEASGARPPSAKETESVQDAALRGCRELVAAQTRRAAQRPEDSTTPPEPSGAEAQLRLGACYRRLGEREKARLWLERARAQAATRERAGVELRALDAGSD